METNPSRIYGNGFCRAGQVREMCGDNDVQNKIGDNTGIKNDNNTSGNEHPGIGRPASSRASSIGRPPSAPASRSGVHIRHHVRDAAAVTTGDEHNEGSFPLLKELLVFCLEPQH